MEQLQSYGQYRVVMDMVVQHLEDQAFVGRDLANVAWALAKLGARNETMALNLICSECMRLDLAKFSPQALSNVLWALASLGNSLI